jgi:PAS domain S-box-containing protein
MPLTSKQSDSRGSSADAGLSELGDIAFPLLVDAVQDYAIFLLDAAGYVLSWNQGAQRSKGYRAEEIIGKHFSAFYTAEERAANRPMHLLGLAAEHGRVEDEGWRVRKDGTRFWADVVVTALRTNDERPYAFVKITRDLTERREAEARDRELLAERQARAAAEEALLARDRFLSIASHELQTPVASLQLAIEGLQRASRRDRLDATRLEGSLERMRRATSRLASLVDELLDVTRLTASGFDFNAEPTDLVAVVDEVVDRFADVDASRRITIDGPPGLVIDGDASRLDQVFTNLIDNALKYSDPADAVDIQLRPAEGGAEVCITDSGIGLDAVAAGRIFEAFGRGDNAAHIPGLGLGLFIAKRIVEHHGGTLSFQDGPNGRGTTFRVWLPQAAAES